jgi:hypothetical protein
MQQYVIFNVLKEYCIPKEEEEEEEGNLIRRFRFYKYSSTDLRVNK